MVSCVTGLQFSSLDKINFLNCLLYPLQDFFFGRIFFYLDLFNEIKAMGQLHKKWVFIIGDM